MPFNLSDYHNQVHLNDTGGYLVRVDIGEGVFVYVRLSIYPLIIVTSYQSEHNGSAWQFITKTIWNGQIQMNSLCTSIAAFVH